MDLQNIECQLAQAQMSRYLAGDALPEDTLQQLEKHVSGCNDCQRFADEKRVSLQEMLKTEPAAEPETKQKTKKKKAEPEPASAPEAREVVDVLGDLMDAPAPALTDLYAAPAPTQYVPQTEPETEDLSRAFEPDASILDQLTEPDPEPIPDEPEAQPANPLVETAAADCTPEVEEKVEVRTLSNKLPLKQHARTLVLSAALGLVLIGMSVFMRNPTSLLGAKALPKKPAQPAKAEKEAPAPAKEPQEDVEAKQPGKAQEPKAQDPDPIEAEPKKDAPSKPERPHEEKLVVAKADGEIEQRKYAHGKLVAVVPGEHKPTVKPSPKPAKVRSATTRRPRKQTRKHRPVAVQAQRRSPHGSIRVYDSNGRPIASAR